MFALSAIQASWWGHYQHLRALNLLFVFPENVQFKKISILPPQKGLEFLGGWEDLEDQKIQRNVGSFTGVSRGVGGVRKNPFHWGGMDSFWNNTILVFFTYLVLYPLRLEAFLEV